MQNTAVLKILPKYKILKVNKVIKYLSFNIYNNYLGGYIAVRQDKSFKSI